MFFGLPEQVWLVSGFAGRSDWGMCSFSGPVECFGCPQKKPENIRDTFSLLMLEKLCLASAADSLVLNIADTCVFPTSISLHTRSGLANLL